MVSGWEIEGTQNYFSLFGNFSLDFSVCNSDWGGEEFYLISYLVWFCSLL